MVGRLHLLSGVGEEPEGAKGGCRRRAREPPGASRWRLEQLHEVTEGLRAEGQRGGDRQKVTSSWSAPPPPLPSTSPSFPALPFASPPRAECRLQGAGDRVGHGGKVNMEVQQTEEGRGLRAKGGGVGAGGLSW